ncbi:hypothetical protein SCLCIDRAFT_29802 [Scleroderma citrinum Foug A]|uniref:Uncharacterized protein n=1 Tax=Scleroderma citrinum Foug A TaxID=1036808 RepID=A0A0C3DIN1_9AGAM|nr:hypothetical protein SCLCIDRAFT_29802 [Scleroderma citrinum Foug A]
MDDPSASMPNCGSYDWAPPEADIVGQHDMAAVEGISDALASILAIKVSSPDGEDITMDIGSMEGDHAKAAEECEVTRPSMDIERSDAARSCPAKGDMQID